MHNATHRFFLPVGVFSSAQCVSWQPRNNLTHKENTGRETEIGRGINHKQFSSQQWLNIIVAGIHQSRLTIRMQCVPENVTYFLPFVVKMSEVIVN